MRSLLLGNRSREPALQVLGLADEELHLQARSKRSVAVTRCALAVALVAMTLTLPVPGCKTRTSTYPVRQLVDQASTPYVPFRTPLTLTAGTPPGPLYYRSLRA